MTSANDGIENTTWTTGLTGDASVMSFEPGGAVAFSRRNNSWTARGQWTKTGVDVHFDCNNFTIYDVALEGDWMIGEWHQPTKPDQRGSIKLFKVDASFSMVDPFSLTRDQLSPALNATAWRTDASAIENTVWSSTRAAAAATTTFLPGGQVLFGPPNAQPQIDAVHAVGSWAVEGDVLVYDLYEKVHFCLVLGDRMVGEWRIAKNQSSQGHHAMTQVRPVDRSHAESIRSNPQAQALVNTRWTTKAGGDDSESIILGPDGEVFQHYRETNDDGSTIDMVKPSLGRWSVNGDQVSFDRNLFTVNVNVLDGNTMTGAWHRAKDTSVGHDNVTLRSVVPLDLDAMTAQFG